MDVADEARDGGLQRGDVITAIDGVSIAGVDRHTIRELGFRLAPGASSTLEVWRGAMRLSLTMHAPMIRP